MAIQFITDNKFEDKLTGDLTIVNFFADWCGPCKMFAKVLEELESKGNVKVIKLNVDMNQEASKKAGVSGIPASFFYKDKKIVDELTGFLPLEALEEKLSKL